MPFTPYLVQDLRRMALQCAGLPTLDKAEFLELLDLAEAALVRRASDALRAKKHRSGASKTTRKGPPRRPLEAVGKEAPPAPKIPTAVPVAKDGFQKPTVLPHGLDGNANFVGKHVIVKPILVPSPFAAVLSRLPTAKKVDLTSPQS